MILIRFFACESENVPPPSFNQYLLRNNFSWVHIKQRGHLLCNIMGRILSRPWLYRCNHRWHHHHGLRYHLRYHRHDTGHGTTLHELLVQSNTSRWMLRSSWSISRSPGNASAKPSRITSFRKCKRKSKYYLSDVNGLNTFSSTIVLPQQKAPTQIIAPLSPKSLSERVL